MRTSFEFGGFRKIFAQLSEFVTPAPRGALNVKCSSAKSLWSARFDATDPFSCWKMTTLFSWSSKSTPNGPCRSPSKLMDQTRDLLNGRVRTKSRVPPMPHWMPDRTE